MMRGTNDRDKDLPHLTEVALGCECDLGFVESTALAESNFQLQFAFHFESARSA